MKSYRIIITDTDGVKTTRYSSADLACEALAQVAISLANSEVNVASIEWADAKRDS